MSNVGKPRIVKGSTPARNPATLHVYQGFVDSAIGLPFPKKYETFPKPHALNYERGRQYAAIVKGMLGNVPKWKMTEKFPSYMNKLPHSVKNALMENIRYLRATTN